MLQLHEKTQGQNSTGIFLTTGGPWSKYVQHTNFHEKRNTDSLIV